MLSTTSAHPFKLHMSWPKACCLMQSKLCTSTEGAKASMMQFIDRAKSSFAPRWLLHMLQSTATTALHKRIGQASTPDITSEKSQHRLAGAPVPPGLASGSDQASLSAGQSFALSQGLAGVCFEQQDMPITPYKLGSGGTEHASYSRSAQHGERHFLHRKVALKHAMEHFVCFHALYCF